MKLKYIAIERQEDDSFAIVVLVEYPSGAEVKVTLESAPKANQLNEVLSYYLQDEEALQICVDNNLQRFA